jgi:hypothetical protein
MTKAEHKFMRSDRIMSLAEGFIPPFKHLLCEPDRLVRPHSLPQL